MTTYSSASSSIKQNSTKKITAERAFNSPLHTIPYKGIRSDPSVLAPVFPRLPVHYVVQYEDHSGPRRKNFVGHERGER